MITRRRQSQSFCLYSYLTGAESSRRKTLPESVSERTKRGDGERDRCWRGKKRATMVKKAGPSVVRWRASPRSVPTIWRPFPSMMMYNVDTHSAPLRRSVPVTAQRREGGREKGQPSRRLSDPPQCVLNRQSEEEEERLLVPQRDGINEVSTVDVRH